MDCGPTCLKMISKHYGKDFSLNSFRLKAGITKQGVTLLGISEAAESCGFETKAVKLSFDQLFTSDVLPAIIHWQHQHFVVIPPQKRPKRKVLVADPAHSMMIVPVDEFKEKWISTDVEQHLGVALLLDPKEEFYHQEEDVKSESNLKTIQLLILKHKKYFFQLAIASLFTSFLGASIPFLTKMIVDRGIKFSDLKFVQVVLFVQLILLFARLTTDLIRDKTILFIGQNINLHLISDFWKKLLQLPISFFEVKKTGDILQRINDQNRIEAFLTISGPTTLFSLVNFFVFTGLLLSYGSSILIIALIGSIAHFAWIFLFLNYRRVLEYRRFAVASRENSLSIQMINGVHDIKLSNSEKLMRSEWEAAQASLFRVASQSQNLSQYQQLGSFLIGESKNLVIFLFAYSLVIHRTMSFGSLLAIQYILGQLNSPISQLVTFIQQLQDSKISLERLQEIQELPNEDDQDKLDEEFNVTKHDIVVKDLTYSYPGEGVKSTIDGVSFTIEEGKITAVVGGSGSGKTTLIKILLKYYDNYKGAILVGGVNVRHVTSTEWRKQCATILPESFIFHTTIARNIALGFPYPDWMKLRLACEYANLLSYINSQPMGFNTIVGGEGVGLSQGQRQRLLIARAIYKDATFVFFDEATNALDAKNEHLIVENLRKYFEGKTVLISAHRLSTIKEANKILVLDDGKIVEQGTHSELLLKRKYYYDLIKHQL